MRSPSRLWRFWLKIVGVNASDVQWIMVWIFNFQFTQSPIFIHQAFVKHQHLSCKTIQAISSWCDSNGTLFTAAITQLWCIFLSDWSGFRMVIWTRLNGHLNAEPSWTAILKRNSINFTVHCPRYSTIGDGIGLREHIQWLREVLYFPNVC